MGRKSTIIFLLFLIFSLSCKKETGEEILEKKEEIKEEKKFRTYVVYYFNERENIEPKTITIQEKEEEMENLKLLLKNYFSLKEETLFPRGTLLRAIYPFEKNLVLDISIPDETPPLQSAKEELYFVNSLAKTVCLNFQRFKAVNILINGSDRNKFINHIALYVSYKP